MVYYYRPLGMAGGLRRSWPVFSRDRHSVQGGWEQRVYRSCLSLSPTPYLAVATHPYAGTNTASGSSVGSTHLRRNSPLRGDEYSLLKPRCQGSRVATHPYAGTNTRRNQTLRCTLEGRNSPLRGDEYLTMKMRLIDALIVATHPYAGTNTVKSSRNHRSYTGRNSPLRGDEYDGT